MKEKLFKIIMAVTIVPGAAAAAAIVAFALNDNPLPPTPPIVPNGVLIEPDELDLQLYASYTLQATVTPIGAPQDVIWTSLNEDIATVDSHGKVTATGIGYTDIIATAVAGDQPSNACLVTVSYDPILVEEIDLDPTSTTLNVGDTQKISATVSPAGASSDLSWSSNNPSVATVDRNGLVTAQGLGSATITAAATDGSGVAATCSVQVTKIFPESIVLDPSIIENLHINHWKEIKAKVYPELAPQSVEWSSNNPDVASVDNTGKVIAHSVGEATITAWTYDRTGNKIEATCKVSTYQPSPSEQGFIWSVIQDKKEAKITGYKGEDKEIIIPSEVEDSTTHEKYTVTAIGGSAFAHSAIESCTIPNTVTLIEQRAFYNCDSLKTIDIPTSVEDIQQYAFSGDDGMTSATIGAKHIHPYAFYSCWKLKTIILSHGVETIDNNAFGDCPVQSLYISDTVKSINNITNFPKEYMETIVVDAGNTAYSSGGEDGNCLIEIATETLIIGTDNAKIPEIGVKTIGSNAFQGCSSFKLDGPLPSTIKKIDNYAFDGCRSFSVSALPNNIEYIGDYAFRNCEFKNIFIPSSLNKIGLAPFANCPVSSIIVDNGNEQFTSSFKGEECNALFDKKTEVLLLACENTKLPEGLTTIGDYAFCGSLIKNIELPQTITTIGNYAFAECKQLVGDEEGKITLPNSIKSLGNHVFENDDQFKEINIPDQLTIIPGYAFYGCSKLNKINIPNHITSIEAGAFQRCSGLEEIEIPNSITRIESYTFKECSNLGKIKWGDRLEYIGREAFAKCSKLNDFELNEGLKQIDYVAFQANDMLTEINLPSTIETIGQYAFAVSTLKKITYNGLKSDLQKALTSDMAGEPSDWMPFICKDGAYNLKGDAHSTIFYDISINNGGVIESVEETYNSADIVISFDPKGFSKNIVVKQGTIESERIILIEGEDYFVEGNKITIAKSKWGNEPEKNPIYFDIKLN